ncbi:MAG: ABC transporter substrate-binding protein [Alphaproteobacteria bacterium]|nr:ABC transporter substrate-binding protein [Alphaproteobacteria bacterium]
MMRKFAFISAIVFMLAGFGQSAFAATADDAKAYATTIGEKVLTIMNDDKLRNNHKLAHLEALFVDVVDVDWVGRFVLGRHWRSASEAQKEAYLPAYRDFLIKHYTSRFAEYSGETFSIEQAEARRAGEYMVRMNIQRPRGQEPVIVDYMLRERGDSFKVFDIVVEGVSLINTQRSEFTSAVERKGLDKLIGALKSKTNSLAMQTSQELDAKTE